MTFILRCGPWDYPLSDRQTLVLCPDSIGCSMVGGNDLFDLGFTVEGLRTYGLKLLLDNKIIMEIKGEPRKTESDVQRRSA